MRAKQRTLRTPTRRERDPGRCSESAACARARTTTASSASRRPGSRAPGWSRICARRASGRHAPKLIGRDAIRALFPETERSAQQLAQLIGHALPPGYGFALLVFSFGEGGYLTHVSNAQRADLVKTLRECADTMEAGLDAPPGVVANDKVQ
jgi:hypothetical protein